MTQEDKGREGDPHIYRVGAYLFFGLCAFSVSVLAGALTKRIGAPDMVRDFIGYVTIIVVFMTLRDMTKQTRALASGEG